MLIERDLDGAAEAALSALNHIKACQASQRGESQPGAIAKGVAKLGFSWEALDVKMWDGGRPALKDALYQLSQSIEISKEFTGQPHDCENLIVQEYMVHDLEL